MEAKKNPDQDVHRQSFRFFLIGLAISVCIAIIAFEWTTEKTPYTVCAFNSEEATYWEILPNQYEPIKSVSLDEKKIQPQLVNLIPVTIAENVTEENPTVSFTQYPHPYLSEGIEFIAPEEDSTTVITLAEVAPVPVGGFESFYSQISKNLKYPYKAVRNGVDGKVFVEFVVDRNGRISNMKILKGIGAGCDEEAMRVMALTNWEPGRQRGKPVNVRMIIPITFKINK